jgi:1,2-diacylglycerol 3-alpha-glucosyltransferase
VGPLVLKLVLCMFRYLPAAGGSVRGLQMLAEGLARKGQDVSVVTMLEPGLKERETLNGVDVVRLRMRHIAGFRMPVGYGKAISSLNPDIVHTNGNRIWAFDWYHPSEDNARAHVVTLHGFYHHAMPGARFKRVYYDTYLPAKLAMFDAVVTQTQEETEFIVSRGYPRERVHLITTGVDRSEFFRNGVDREAIRRWWNLGTPRIALYAGGLYDNKRVDRLIQAVGKTKGEWGLVIAGTWEPGGKNVLNRHVIIQQYAGARCIFTGEVDRKTVIDAFHSADAYVQGSSFEGFGLALLEAMAADLPFVAFDAGAARELAATGAGKVVSSPEEMAKVLHDVPFWFRRGSGRHAAQRFSTERTVEEHLRLYESLLAGKSAPLIPSSH